jgi:microcystin-dependent protein
MSQPYVGEIRCFGFTFAPTGWAFCNGQLVAISQNPALYSILGTTYGGDGVQTFGLPNLQGTVPLHWGTSPSGLQNQIGQTQGSTTVTLTVPAMPAHFHTITVQEVAPGGTPERTATPNPSAWLADSSPGGVYNSAPTLDAPFSQSAITPVGNSIPHENMQPYLVLSFCISLYGVFPSRN